MMIMNYTGCSAFIQQITNQFATFAAAVLPALESLMADQLLKNGDDGSG